MNSDKIDRKNSIGVAFSGGGLQGIAHIGAVQALYELGIHPQYVSGTSSGAAMAAIVAMGCDSDEMKSCLLYTSPIRRQRQMCIRDRHQVG